VPGFQFYFGDLGNSVPFANYQPAGDRFNVVCVFDKARSGNLKLSRYSDS
jgi:hypothetical protein